MLAIGANLKAILILGLGDAPFAKQFLVQLTIDIDRETGAIVDAAAEMPLMVVHWDLAIDHVRRQVAGGEFQARGVAAPLDAPAPGSFADQGMVGFCPILDAEPDKDAARTFQAQALGVADVDLLTWPEEQGMFAGPASGHPLRLADLAVLIAQIAAVKRLAFSFLEIKIGDHGGIEAQFLAVGFPSRQGLGVIPRHGLSDDRLPGIGLGLLSGVDQSTCPAVAEADLAVFDAKERAAFLGRESESGADDFGFGLRGA